MDPLSVESVTVYATDIERTKKFYEVLGFLFEKSGDWTSYHYHTKVAEGISFAIHSTKTTRGSSMTLGFRVNNVPEILRTLHKAGETILRPNGPMAIRIGFQDRRFAEVRDPDGRVVRLYERSARS